MNNFELIKEMTIKELTKFLYVNISRKGLKKTGEWLEEEAEKEKEGDVV